MSEPTIPAEPAPGTRSGGPLVRRLRKRSLPAFVRDLLDDRRAVRTLIVAGAAIAAAGLDPHVLDPGLPQVRAALAADPDLQGYFIFNAVLMSAFLILGGFLGDAFRSMRVTRLALAGLAIVSCLAPFAPDLITLWVLRGFGWLCGGIILPFAIGAVAVSSKGLNRATALGVAYGIYGAATAVAPALILLFGVDGPAWAAFLACAIAAVIALWLSRGVRTRVPAPRSLRSGMAVVGLFAFGVVSFAGGLIDVTADVQLLRIGPIVLGIGAMLAALAIRFRIRRVSVPPIALRPVTVALIAGVVIGFAQAAPLLHLPILFQYVQGAPALLATAAIAPFVIALLVAGPVSGLLLARYRPRTLIGGGVIAVGLANLLLWLLLERTMHYFGAVIPFLLIGSGFVIATTVRTAVIFANMPSRMPAMAVAFNEASIGLGSRLGVVVATVVTMQVALAALPRPYAGGIVSARIGETSSAIRDLVLRIGIPSEVDITAGLGRDAVTRAFDAIVEGMRTTELILGLLAIVTGILVWLALRDQDPVGTVWELADERDPDGEEAFGPWTVADRPGSARTPAPSGG